MQQLQPFSHKFILQETDASDIAARLVEAGHETELDRITSARENDWYRRCRRFCRHDRWGSASEDHTDTLPD
jgi:hypothetical protein